MRQLPFFKRKKGWSVAGTGEVYGDSGGGSAYELPTASADTKGGVKIGSGLTMDGEVLSADAYTLPTAAADTKGGVKIGSNLSMTGEVLSADVSQTDVNTRLKKVSTMPTASADNLGDIVIYTGATDATYTNGYAYKCVSDGGDPATYSWTASPVQASQSGFNPASNAGAHNAIYRGQSLGTSVSAAQYAQIQAGTFEDMFIGDYWTIGGVVYRIAAFDYWLHCGDTECTDHHIVLVPDTNFTAQKMNDTNITDGGYVGSKMYTTYLNDAKSAIETAFGSAHILSHRELLTNTVASGIATNWSWYDSTVDLMNEVMVYGCTCGSKPVTYSIDFNIGIDKSQLPLFALDPSRICNRAYWWLRSVVSATDFAYVDNYGHAASTHASDALGVRPAFAIYQPTV